jgi:hypothetical protein
VIAALFVAPSGSYINVPGVDPWDKARDARNYRGPYPVVCHPPCQRWGKFWAGQPLYIKQTGIRKVKGADDGCFEFALNACQTWGGIAEHPQDSHAWEHFGLNKPPRSGGWIKADDKGGWTCRVEQGRYGHYARKPTWLIAYHCEVPELDWGSSKAKLDPAIVERMGLERAKRLGEVGGKGGGKDSAPRIGTPTPFRDLLLSIARTAKPPRPLDKVARDVVKKWGWDCGDSLQLSFVQSELLQQRIIEAMAASQLSSQHLGTENG